MLGTGTTFAVLATVAHLSVVDNWDEWLSRCMNMPGGDMPESCRCLHLQQLDAAWEVGGQGCAPELVAWIIRNHRIANDLRRWERVTLCAHRTNLAAHKLYVDKLNFVMKPGVSDATSHVYVLEGDKLLALQELADGFYFSEVMRGCSTSFSSLSFETMRRGCSGSTGSALTVCAPTHKHVHIPFTTPKY